MATTETNTELGQQIVEDAKHYVLYSWSVQDAINPIAVERAEGRHFWDYDGNRYLDFASQLVNVSIGHSHPKVVQAIKDQAEKLATIGPPMATESRSRLGKLLAEVTPGDLTMSFFTNGGAEANENAIKLARWYTGRHKIIARYRSYHGATAGAITLTGDPRRWPAEPGIPGVVRMFDPYTYRCPAGHPDPCPVCTGAPHLEEILQYEGAHTVAAVILETVTGTNGIIVPPDGYLQSIREVCDRHGILLIADEVMAGFGRTGKWFAVDNWNVVPDILTVAKGINSGYVPLGAMVVREPIAEWVRDKYFAGGLTYSGHPLACASAVASIEAFQEEGIVENAAAMGEVFRTELAKLAEKHPSIGEVRGLGCFWGLELVKNRETREPLVPFNGAGEAAKPMARRDEARARPRALPDDALERRHVLPAADDHARRARRGARRRSTTRSRLPTSSAPSALREFALVPDRFTRIGDDVRRDDDGRVCVLQGNTWAAISGLRITDGRGRGRARGGARARRGRESPDVVARRRRAAGGSLRPPARARPDAAGRPGRRGARARLHRGARGRPEGHLGAEGRDLRRPRGRDRDPVGGVRDARRAPRAAEAPPAKRVRGGPRRRRPGHVRGGGRRQARPESRARCTRTAAYS